MEWVGWMLSPLGVIETFNEQVWERLTHKGWSDGQRVAQKEAIDSF
jgi:hypothetical protein